MGFFFQKAGQAKRKLAKTVGAKTPGSRANIPTLHRMGCQACPLNKAKVLTPKMQPTLAEETLVYFLAEAPGRTEDEQGEPLIGPSGQLLRSCIPNNWLEYCSFDNCVRDRPPDNRMPTWVEVECCRNYVTKSIEEARPKLIVGLGAIALQWVTGSADIQGLRGRLLAVKIGNHECYFMPTYHPSFILRRAFNRKNPLNSQFGHCFRMDIERAFSSLSKLTPPKIETEAEIRSGVYIFNGREVVGNPEATTDAKTVKASARPPSLFPVGGTLFDLLAQAKKAKVKAIDIETSTLRPYGSNASILTVAISFNSTNFAFALDHPQAKWSRKEREQILIQLEDILTDGTIKVAHNSPFELEWFIHYFGKEVVKHEVWECTQLQAHFLDERRGAGWGNDDEARRASYQGLDFLIKLHLGFSYKDLFKLNKKDMASSDLVETLIYNGVDTKYTLRLYHLQTKLLKEAGLYDAYVLALPRQATVALMQHLGMDVNQSKVKELQAKLADQIAVIESEINGLDVVKKYLEDKGSFNPMGQDALIVFRDYLNRKEVKITEGEKVRYSIDKHILEKIDHPLAKLIVTLRNRNKMKSTYIDSLELGKGDAIWPDGKIHTNFNTTFTVTGRLSSDQPNFQNFPQRSDSWVREQIVAPEGHYIVAADYGQLEACTAAMCSKDPVLIKALWDDYDIHMEWASKLAALNPVMVGGDFSDPKVAKKFRSLVKNKLVFPAIYGAQNSSIAEYLKIDVSYVDTLMKEFWKTFRHLDRWHWKLTNSYFQRGYTQAPTGRRRHYPITKNEAINAPIQTLAAEIVCDAMNKLSYKAATECKWYLHPRLQIHDDITLVTPAKYLDETIETVYKTMLSPDFDFVNVPISVSMSIGRNWAKMEEIGKFWSHRDL